MLALELGEVDGGILVHQEIERAFAAGAAELEVSGRIGVPTPAEDPSIKVDYPAFGAAGPTRFEEPTSYEGDGTRLEHAITYQWNWAIGEVVTALINVGMRIDALTEHRTVPWNALEGAMVEVPPLGEYELADRPERLPCTFTLQASRPT